jgi:ParB family transcriptional regulator, chromosome partitioning protein
MNKRPRGLGSGLEALLPATAPAAGVRDVATASIRQNPRQPRTQFDEAALDELADSIREHGIIQPLIVSQREEGRFELIAGERRWRAAQRAGLDKVPVIVRETTPQQLLELALIENVQRADLSPLEEAHAYQAMKDDFGLSDEQIARRLGKNSREAIANTRRLLQLVPEAQAALLKSEISAGHGRALLKLKTADQQRQALQAILAQDWTVREAERIGDLVRDYDGNIDRALDELRGRRAARPENVQRAASAPSEPRQQLLSAEDHDLERELERALSTPVKIARTEKDVRVTIVFHTDESFQAFLDALNVIQ